MCGCGSNKPVKKETQTRNGKGDKRRKGEDLKKYRDNYVRIFGKRDKDNG